MKKKNNPMNLYEIQKGNDFIIACSDGNFGLSMKGINGGGSVHKRLMIRMDSNTKRLSCL